MDGWMDGWMDGRTDAYTWMYINMQSCRCREGFLIKQDAVCEHAAVWTRKRAVQSVHICMLICLHGCSTVHTCMYAWVLSVTVMVYVNVFVGLREVMSVRLCYVHLCISAIRYLVEHACVPMSQPVSARMPTYKHITRSTQTGKYVTRYTYNCYDCY